MKGKYLITTDNWFFGPDGKQYKAVYGQVKELSESDIFEEGYNINSSKRFLKIGTEENYIIIAGCQVNYAIKTNKLNRNLKIKTDELFEGKTVYREIPNRILIMDKY